MIFLITSPYCFIDAVLVFEQFQFFQFYDDIIIDAVSTSTMDRCSFV